MEVYVVQDYNCDNMECSVLAVFSNQETARLYSEKAGRYTEVQTVELDPPVTDEWLNETIWWEAQIILPFDKPRVSWYRPAHSPFPSDKEFSITKRNNAGIRLVFVAGHPDTVAARAMEIYQDWKKTAEAQK